MGVGDSLAQGHMLAGPQEEAVSTGLSQPVGGTHVDEKPSRVTWLWATRPSCVIVTFLSLRKKREESYARWV